ncbi:MAG: hypothetical protein Q4G25_05585 [Paracoccus sp. (in: a-proteobacteria)]|nr:hypothetical protein [Paracoccus sp. (in: a-proteobacteria)]
MADWRGMANASGRAMIIGAALTALWLVMLLILWLGSGGTASGPGRWVSVVAALMPLALIWMAVGLARAIDTLRAEAEALRAMLDDTAPGDMPRRDPAPPPAIPASPARTAPAMRPAGAVTGRARPAPPAPTAATATADPRQHRLGLDAPEPVELPAEVVIRALNFPDGPADHEAIAAMREALRDADHARLIRSAQDVVTLLAERGIYTDDLVPGPADPAAWHRFAEGQRGRAVAAVGAVRDPAMLETASSAMRNDEVFRDAMHHFLRLFDRGVTAVMPRLNDDQITRLADTRSARAFMLLARAAGLFGQDSGD